MGVLITNETVKELFHIAQSIARENYNATFGAPHILQALMHNEIGLKGFLENLGKDPGYIYEWSEVRIEDYPKTGRLTKNPEKDETVDRILDEADEIRIRLGLDEISAICILAAVTKSNVGFTAQELKSLPIREHEILNFYNDDETKINRQENLVLGEIPQNSTSTPAISAYCINRTEQAKAEKLKKLSAETANSGCLSKSFAAVQSPMSSSWESPVLGKPPL